MPLLMCLLFAYVIVRVSEDVTAAIRQQPPPRQEYRRAKLDAQCAAAQRQGHAPKPQSPAGRYVCGLMADAWDSAWHRQQLMADQRRHNRERRAARTVQRHQARQDKRDQRQTRRMHTPDGPAPVGFDAQAPEPTELTTDVAAPEPAAETRRASAFDKREADRATAPAIPAEADPAPSEGSKEDTPTGNVIPLPAVSSENTLTIDSAATPQRMEPPTMSSPNGEITGLSSAIQYAADLNIYCAHTQNQIGSVLPDDPELTTSCEQARAQLEAGGVTGQPLADVQSVQEQMTAALHALEQARAQLEAAGAAAASLHTELESHRTVQDASVPVKLFEAGF